MDGPSLTERMKAARALRGCSMVQLAKRINAKGYSSKTLGAIERLERDAQPHELRIIADALEVPEGFLADEDPFDGFADSASRSLRLLHAKVNLLLAAAEIDWVPMLNELAEGLGLPELGDEAAPGSGEGTGTPGSPGEGLGGGRPR